MYISSTIPIPSDFTRIRARYPWSDMEAGDSIAFNTEKDFKKALKAARNWGHRHSKKFNGKFYRGKYRIWRIK